MNAPATQLLLTSLLLLSSGCGDDNVSRGGLSDVQETATAEDGRSLSAAPDERGGDAPVREQASPAGDGGSLVMDGGPLPELEQPPEYPLDDLLRLNNIQVKGTHNSYHLYPDENIVPDWYYQHVPLTQQLDEMGVRQVELDVHWSPEQRFLVYHVPLLDDNSTCETLVDCLTELLAWSDANRGHHTLFILIEPKDDVDKDKIDGHHDELDQEILSVWPMERIVTPDLVRGAHPTLREAILEGGWPTLGQTRDKALFLMLDSSQHKEAYLEGNPNLQGRPMFVRGKPDEPWCTFVEIGNALGDEELIGTLAKTGFMVRSASDSTSPDRVEENFDRAAAALNSGAHLISTDYPAPQPGTDYWFDIPGGNPSRCNPVAFVDGCTPEAVEDL